MNIYMNLGKDSYDIIIKRGALKKVQEYFNLERKVLVVTDSGVPCDYAKEVCGKCKKGILVTIPEGEESKNFENYKLLLETLCENNFTRTDCIVAVGGGVVGDLSGFAASTYMRGIDFYNIPTTLLSQVDSSIGGKVAVNFGEIKNIVGAFYQPKAVVIDPDVLSTLPKRQLLSGFAESVKMAATYDSEFFCKMEDGGLYDIEDIIVRSLLIKKHFVENDEKENGIRAVLNFGHTVGHAIESAGGFSALYHGECVALGMLYMCSSDVKERLKRLLSRVGLPTEHPYRDLYSAITHDKKARDGGITIVYVEKIGEYILKRITLEQMREYIDSL